MNGSDKNVGSIEEDMERCEQLTKLEHANWIGLSNQSAIKHLVEEYKELKEIIQTQQSELEKKDKMIDEIQKEVRDHIGFENILKKDNKEPDLFNQGRFYLANNINNILKGKVENGN